jgi:hypothetical protein
MQNLKSPMSNHKVINPITQETKKSVEAINKVGHTKQPKNLKNPLIKKEK